MNEQRNEKGDKQEQEEEVETEIWRSKKKLKMLNIPKIEDEGENKRRG